MGLWISRDTQHRSLTGSRTSKDGGPRVEKTEPSNHVVLKAENPGLPSAGTALASLPSLTPGLRLGPHSPRPHQVDALSLQQPLWLVLLSWKRWKSGLVGGWLWSLSFSTHSHYQWSILETAGGRGQRRMLVTSQRKHHCHDGTLGTCRRGSTFLTRNELNWTFPGQIWRSKACTTSPPSYLKPSWCPVGSRHERLLGNYIISGEHDIIYAEVEI